MPKVTYKGLISADVREEDLEDALEYLSECSVKERKRILFEVKRNLSKVLKIVNRGETLSKQEKQAAANDIGIWFAGELLAKETN